MTIVGDNERPESTAALIVSVAEAEPFNVPVIDAVVVLFTAVVEIENVAVMAPPRTLTDDGTMQLALFDERLTCKPAGPAAPERVTVPVEGLPPKTDVGETATLTNVAGVIVKDAV